MPANSIRHDHHEAAIIHVQPIASPNKLTLSIPRERAIGFRTKIGFVKSGHEQQLHKRPNQSKLLNGILTPPAATLLYASPRLLICSPNA